MKLLTRMRIGPRLAVLVAALLLAASTLVAVAVARLGAVSDSLQLIAKDRVPKVVAVTDIVEQLNLIARELRNALLFEEPARVAAAVDTVRTARAKIGEDLAKLDKMITSDEGRKRLAKVRAGREAFIPMQEKLIALVNQGQRAEGITYLAEQVRPTQLRYMKALSELKDYQIALIEDAAKEGVVIDRQAQWLLGSLLLAMLLMGGLFGWLIVRSVLQPLARATEAANRIADGDLSQRIEAAGRDEAAVMLQALVRMQTSLGQVVGRVRGSVENVTTASTQIAAGNLDLSSRTEQQASSLQETAASIEELTGTVRQSADTATQASQMAQAACDAARAGGQVVERVVHTMEEISTSSKRIADIIGTIDGIAFQTNILALNAAVEAARAGEQGRGFAVVASEVRSLARRSAEAAREIKSLIGASVERVGTGSELVSQAGTQMQGIVQQVQRVTDLIGEISSAAREQSKGFEQVNQAVAQMDQVTQQNAALVEESAAAAASLKQQAEGLQQAVAVFRLQPAD